MRTCAGQHARTYGRTFVLRVRTYVRSFARMHALALLDSSLRIVRACAYALVRAHARTHLRTYVRANWHKLGQHAGDTHGTCVPRRWYVRTHGASWGSTQVAHMARTGAARRWHTWHMCAPQVGHMEQTGPARRWHTWHKLGQHAASTHGTCAPRRWHTWRKLGRHAGGTHGRNWGSTHVAHMAHVCHAGATHGANWGQR